MIETIASDTGCEDGIQLGRDERDPNRFILVQHNYVRREHTTTKSKKSRRVDLSRELRRELVELRDKRLLEAYLEGKNRYFR